MGLRSLQTHYHESAFITLDTGHLGVASKLNEAVSNIDNVSKVEGSRQDSITVHEDEEVHDEKVHAEHSEDDPKMDVVKEKEDEKEITMLKGALKEKASCISDLIL